MKSYSCAGWFYPSGIFYYFLDDPKHNGKKDPKRTEMGGLDMLKLFPVGSPVTLLDAVYRRSIKDENTCKWNKPTMTLVYKDNTTGRKHHEVINDPKFEYWVANDDVEVPHHLFFIEKNKAHPVECPCNKIEKSIADLFGQTDIYYDNLNNGNNSANKLFHFNPRVFMSDMHVEDFYRFKFDQLYKNEVGEVNKAFFDIEVDGKHAVGDFPKYDDSPINAICLINLKTNQVFSYLLDMPESESYKEFKKNFNQSYFDDLRSLIMNKVGGWKNYIRFGLDKLEYNVAFYEDEVQLIQDLFIGINKLQPDFLLAWNMAFDIPFIMDRLQYLGISPADIMCHPDFETKEAVYVIDERNRDEFAERNDFARISSYTVYLDQMILFASRRKGQSAFKSFKLDDIGKQVAKIGKVDYHHICNSLIDLPYKDYKTFWMYNVLDVIVQVCIENKTGDVDYVYGKCIANNTRFAKAHRQTVYLANRAAKSFFNMGYLIGNNINKINPKPESKFKGAVVLSPSLIHDDPKIKIHGIPIDVYDNLDDFDYARLYPSTIQEFNMAVNTMKGKIFIPELIHDNENPFGDPKYNRGGAYIEDLQSHNFLEFGHRWLHLADYATLIKDVREYFSTQTMPSGPLDVRYDGRVSPFVPFYGGEQRIYPFTKVTNKVRPFIKTAVPDFTQIDAYFMDKKGV